MARRAAIAALSILALTITCGSDSRPEARGSSPTSGRKSAEARGAAQSCFILHELGAGRRLQSPAEACRLRLTPASTFKIPHALAAIDSGVLKGPDHELPYDGSPQYFDSWKRNHTLSSAMRDSVLWYFRELAKRLGLSREQEYLNRLDYGNADLSSGLTSFWVGGSLLISPEEQERFLVRLYQNSLPVSREAQSIVRRMLVQPASVVVNAAGEHEFAAPWAPGTILSAKTGRSDPVKWLVGHVKRGDREWIFVSCVVGDGPMAAIELAAKSLRQAGVI